MMFAALTVIDVVCFGSKMYLPYDYKHSSHNSFFDSLFVAFELTFLTSDKQNAGTTQNAWIVLEGEERKYQEYSVENSAKNKVLRRGQTYTFKFAIKSLRNLTHVTLGHRRRQGSVVKGTGKETGWFLHEVIVTNPETGEK